MRKLAVIVDTFPRWSERFIARELRELARRGVDFSVFCLKAGDLPDAEDADWHGLIERRVVLPSCLVPSAYIERNRDPDAARRLKAARAELGLSMFSRVSCAEKLTTLLREDKFQHVHAHFANLPSTIGWIAAQSAKIPFSMSVHARDLFVEAQLLKEKLSDAVMVFACHARAAEHLQGKYGDRNKMVLVKHGLPLERHPFSERTPRTSGAPFRLLAAGRFVEKKGFDDLIEAVALSNGVTLILCGDGPLKKNLQARIKKSKLSDVVTVSDPLSGSALQNAYAAADSFVAPHREAADGDSDGVPNTILEAFAAGVPVIGTSAGSMAEVLTEQRGVLSAPADPKSLAAAIAWAREHGAELEQRAAAARAFVEKQYDIQKNIAPLLEMLA
jgi:glycosyltransferase involved in cell wall biosynthesis